MQTIVVMGAAPNLGQDLASLGAVEADFMAINRSGISSVPAIRYWATLHPGDFSAEAWHEQRHAIGGNMDFETITRLTMPDLSVPGFRHGGPSVSGSSTLYGVSAALILGYERIIVAGAPLSDSAYRIFRLGWLDMLERMRGKVFSLSGWTRDLLGAPDA